MTAPGPDLSVHLDITDGEPVYVVAVPSTPERDGWTSLYLADGVTVTMSHEQAEALAQRITEAVTEARGDASGRLAS